jgi:hypothetical protein
MTKSGFTQAFLFPDQTGLTRLISILATLVLRKRHLVDLHDHVAESFPCSFIFSPSCRSKLARELFFASARNAIREQLRSHEQWICLLLIFINLQLGI